LIRSSFVAALLVLAPALLVGRETTSATRESAARPAGWNHYGDPAPWSSEAVAIGAMSGDEQNIVVRGTIQEVCPVKGCWMRVTDEAGEELFVKFKDYGFFVPRDAAGQRLHRRIGPRPAVPGVLSEVPRSVE